MHWNNNDTTAGLAVPGTLATRTEAMELIDGDGTKVASFTKTAAGVVSLEIGDSGVGAVSGSGAQAAESVLPLRKTTITLDGLEVTITDEDATCGYGGLKIYDFPAGGILLLGAIANLSVTARSRQTETATVTAVSGCTGDGNLIVTITSADLTGSPLDVTVALTTADNSATKVAVKIAAALAANAAIAAVFTVSTSTVYVVLDRQRDGGTDASLNIDIDANHIGTTATGITDAGTSATTFFGISQTFDGDFALGTTDAGGTPVFSATENNILPSTSMAQAVAGVTAAVHGLSSVGEIGLHDGTGSAKDVCLNFLIDDADQSNLASDYDSALVATGTVTLYWINLGDY